MTIASIIGLALLLALTIFQILLVVGRPFGEFAWGGQHKILPTNLRIASIFSVILYGVFAVFLASKAGVIEIITSPTTLNAGMWIVTIYFILGIFVNLISRNKKERMLMTPVATLLAVTFLLTLLS